MKVFLEVFPDDFHINFPERDINIGIEILLDKIPVLISPYWMHPNELKDKKTQLKVLLDKGFNKS